MQYVHCVSARIHVIQFGHEWSWEKPILFYSIQILIIINNLYYCPVSLHSIGKLLSLLLFYYTTIIASRRYYFFSFARQCSIVALFHIGMVRIDVQWLTIPVLIPPDIRLNRKKNWCNLRLVVYLPQGVKDSFSAFNGVETKCWYSQWTLTTMKLTYIFILWQ